jgi:hypothetical protein
MKKSRGYDVLAGYYGYDNFGDDLFREILSQSLSQKPWARPRISQNRPGPLARYTRNARAINNIFAARSLTLGGGSILGARPPFGIRHVEMAAARLHWLAYAAIGVGILEDLKTPPDDILSRLGWVGLRSETEYLTLRQRYPQVQYMSDLAYAAPRVLLGGEITANLSARKEEVAIIPAGVGQLGRSAADRDHLRAWISGNLTPFVHEGKNMKILLLQPQNETDTALCQLFAQEVARLGASVRQIAHRDAVTTLKEVASSAFVFTDRLHGGIVAHVCGVPFRLSRHHAKCDDLLADIRHPDPVGTSYAADVSGNGNKVVEEWTLYQSTPLRRHAELANAGIQSWLSFLEQRAT